MRAIQIYIFLIVSMASCNMASGAIELPRGTYAIAELDRAKEEAAQKDRPIAFLYTNLDSTCPLCVNATNQIVEEFKNKAILVNVDKLEEAPETVSKLLSSRGKYVPKVAIFDSAVKEDIALLTYEDIKENGKKAFREVLKAIRKHKKSPKTSYS